MRSWPGECVFSGGWTEAANKKGRGSNEPRPPPQRLWLLGDGVEGFTSGCFFIISHSAININELVLIARPAFA